MITVYADVGIRNRVYSLCNCLAIASILSVETQFFWPINKNSGFDYPELFATERIPKNKNKLDIHALEH